MSIRALLQRNTEEITAVLRGLNGEYILPEAGGDLLRDGAGVLPTGELEPSPDVTVSIELCRTLGNGRLSSTWRPTRGCCSLPSSPSFYCNVQLTRMSLHDKYYKPFRGLVMLAFPKSVLLLKSQGEDFIMIS